MLLISRSLLIAVLYFGFTSVAIADDGSDDIDKKESKNQVVEQHPWVTEKGNEFSILEKSFIPDEVSDAVKKTIEIPTVQARDIIRNRLQRLPDIPLSYDDPSLVKAIGELVYGYEHLGDIKDVDWLIDLKNWVRLDLVDKDLEQKIERAIAQVTRTSPPLLHDITEMNHQLTTDPEYRRLGEEYLRIQRAPKTSAQEKAHRRALKELAGFEDRLHSRVIAQDDVVEGLKNLYVKDLFTNGVRKAPEVFYLMGLPGTGKDTIAEAWTDAMWAKPGAHEDHMFRMTINSKEEFWDFIGSGKGYVGSDEVTDFVKWLVRHSGGKYVLAKEEKQKGPIVEERIVVHKNPAWTPQDTSISNGPHRATLFINEAHNIPKEVKDGILKEAIEKGRFKLNNAGQAPNAVSEIYLPINIIIATNEGIELLEPREKNGTRIGEPLPFEDLHDNWQRVKEDKGLLKQTILKNNGQINDPVTPKAPGTSEEFINRIPEHRLLLMEPLSPDQLFEIALLEAKARLAELVESTGRLGSYDVQISKELYRFIVDYRYIAADNARPIKGRLNSMVFERIFEAIKNERIRPTGQLQYINVDLKHYKNGAATVVFEVIDPKTGEIYEFTRIIRETLADIPAKPISDQRIQEMARIGETMGENVFGVDHIIDRLVESAIVAESESLNSGKSSRPANVVAFLGLTSTGKTETGKQYVNARYGPEGKIQIIDFNGVRTVADMEAKIIGSYDHNKNPIASEFMKAYDRANGELTFIFDEAANSPKELLKGLYEILREANPSNFSDGKSRPMKNVTIIITGNAGEEIYDMIPRDLPKPVYERAMNEVFNIFVNNEDMQHRILQKTFPDAFLARLGSNIFHFGPLQAAPKREISQLKLEKGIKNLQPKASERGWNLVFDSHADLIRMLEMIEGPGFAPRSQGASIDKFVSQNVIDKIKAKLLVKAVPNGATVRISVPESVESHHERGAEYSHKTLGLTTENGKTHEVKVPIKKTEYIHRNDRDRSLTGYHEIGHELSSRVYMGDLVSSNFISIIEGVGMIGGEMVHYAGVRSGILESDFRTNKEVVLRHVALWAGGYVAQNLVTAGARDDSGKSNDQKRATDMIQDAILRGGLSERWGKRAIPAGMDLNTYFAQLSEKDRELLKEITDDWLKDGERLAREAILINDAELFMDLSKELARKGLLEKKEIEDIYERHQVITERDGKLYYDRLADTRKVLDIVEKGMAKADKKTLEMLSQPKAELADYAEVYNRIADNSNIWLRLIGANNTNLWGDLTKHQRWVASAALMGHTAYQSRDAQFAVAEMIPKEVANIERLIEKDRAEKTGPVTKAEKFSIAKADGNVEALPWDVANQGSQARVRCGALFQ